MNILYQYYNELLVESANYNLDKKYFEAIKHNDLDTIQKLVDQKAKSSWFNPEIPMQHSTTYKGYNIKAGGGDVRISGFAIWLTDFGNKSNAAHNIKNKDFISRKLYTDFGSNGELFLKIRTPQELEIARVKYSLSNWELEQSKTEKHQMDDLNYSLNGDSIFNTDFPFRIHLFQVNKLQKDGYLGIIVEKEASGVDREYIIFDSKLIKSADPITKDDNGNIIPPSRRFNSKINDIRY